MKDMENNWISVEDRLPDYDDPDLDDIVIVSGIEDGERYVYYAHTYEYGKDGGVFSVAGWSMKGVTHWMPLPPPPQQNNNKE